MRKFNFEIILKVVVLFGFILLFSRLVTTGGISLYVHPRIVPFIIATIIGMVLITLALFTQIFKKNRVRKRVTTYILFIIPIAMAFTIGGENITSSSINERNISLKGGQGPSSMSSIDKMDTILIDDGNFVQFLNDSNENYYDYLNKKIEIEGFVYKNDTLTKNQFVIGRFMMTCCTADMSIVGIICNYDLAVKYDNDTWVKVIGRLEKSEVNGEELAVIKVENIERVKKPESQYVYPY